LPAPGSETLRLGESARIAGVTVRALRVEEDSRCPATVQCIQAGTVRLRIAIVGEADEAMLRLHEPQNFGSGAWLMLLAVCPEPRVPGPIAPAAYRFTLIASHGPVTRPHPAACPSPP
jgi:hypothetical protein